MSMRRTYGRTDSVCARQATRGMEHGWERERDCVFMGMGGKERERYIGRERERDCLLIGTEIVSSIVMSNLGVGPGGTL